MDRFVPPFPRAPRTSGMAITSLVQGIASFICWIFTGLPAIVLGVLALRNIHRSGGQLKGDGLAIGGIVTGGVATIFVAPMILALLLPAVQAAREAARINTSLSNLKQLVLACHSYADQERTFPAPGGGTGAGSQLSWRVRILPFIEEQALYEQFHFDEPWDSPHNRPLVARMPKVFGSPSGDLPPGQTPYLAVTGPGTAFDNPETGHSFGDFKDGTSKTVVIVEADHGVDWTRPDDWQFDPADPTRGLGALHHGIRFLAAFGDGHASMISMSAAPEVVAALMTRVGHERVDVP